MFFFNCSTNNSDCSSIWQLLSRLFGFGCWGNFVAFGDPVFCGVAFFVKSKNAVPKISGTAFSSVIPRRGSPAACP